MKLLLWLITNVLALLLAIWLFDGITLTADSRADRIIQLVITGAILGAINSLVKPVIKLVSLPFIILTLGLFLLVINALLLLLTSRIADTLELGFHVEGFWVAVWGSIVISLAAMVIDAILPDRD